MNTSFKKNARAVRASVASGVVFVQSFPDCSGLTNVTAASLTSNKAAYKCDHCHTPIVASAGAAPSCVVCGTKTREMTASVKIAPPKDLSSMTAVECGSCGSVSMMEQSVVTASAHRVHCAVCGTHNDYTAASKRNVSASTKVTSAVRLNRFWNAAANDFSSSYRTTRGVSVAQAETILSGNANAIGLPQANGRILIAEMSEQDIARMKKVDTSGRATTKGTMFPRLRRAMQLAESYNDPNAHPVLFSSVEDTETSFGVGVFKGNVVMAGAVTHTIDHSEHGGDESQYVASGSDEGADDINGTDETLDDEGSGEWPFEVTSDMGEGDEETVEMLDDPAGDSDDLMLESDAMSTDGVELDDLGDLDIDEVASSGEDDMEVVSAHSEMQLPSVPDEMGCDPKMNECTDGDDLADVLDMDDTDAGLSFDIRSNRVVAMKGHVAIASLSAENAGENADIMRTLPFHRAVTAMAKTDGMRKALTTAGFVSIKIPTVSNTLVARKVQAALIDTQRKHSEAQSTLVESMAIAAAGLARGKWRGKENPLLAAFESELRSVGVRNPERVVARVLASSLVPFSRTLVEVASEVNRLSPSARKETASLLEMTNVVGSVDEGEEDDASVSQEELETRFKTTAAVLRATAVTASTTPKSLRRNEVVASAHATAMSILNGDSPLSLG